MSLQLSSSVARRAEIAVRSGGHNGAGFGSVDDGLVIDLSAMRGVDVDADAPYGPRPRRHPPRPGGRRRRTSTGSRRRSGSSPPRVSAGLTLGGGVGHLTRDARALDRQPARGRGRARRRLDRPSRRGRERRSLLGASRRGRELRRRDVVHVPAQPGSAPWSPARCSGRSSSPPRYSPGTPSSCRSSRTCSTASSRSSRCRPGIRFPPSFISRRCARWSGATPDADEAEAARLLAPARSLGPHPGRRRPGSASGNPVGVRRRLPTG